MDGRALTYKFKLELDAPPKHFLTFKLSAMAMNVHLYNLGCAKEHHRNKIRNLHFMILFGL